MPFLRRDGRGQVAGGQLTIGMRGILVGVGLPMISVSKPIMLWK